VDFDSDELDDQEERNPIRHPLRLPAYVDRQQEFHDYALAMAEVKGADLEDLAARLGVPLDTLAERRSSSDFRQVRQRVHQSTMAASVCRVKLAERQVELLEAMLAIALTPGKEQAKMLLGLKDSIIPSALSRSLTNLANASATTQTSLGASMAAYVEKMAQVEAPKRTIDTEILSGKAALPTATRLKPESSDDDR